MKTAENANALFEAIVANLTEDDDQNFWHAALNVLADEFLHRYEKEAKNREWVFIVGACSHWVRPHPNSMESGGRLRVAGRLRQFSSGTRLVGDVFSA